MDFEQRQSQSVAIAALILVGLMVVGCTQSNPTTANTTLLSNWSNDSVGHTPAHETGLPFENHTNNVSVAVDGFLCSVQNGTQQEYLVGDNDTYVYELHRANQLKIEMVFSNNTLYYQDYTTAVPNCAWAMMTRDDLKSIHRLGGVNLLPPEQLYAQIPSSVCKKISVHPDAVQVPHNSCPIRVYILKALAK